MVKERVKAKVNKEKEIDGNMFELDMENKVWKILLDYLKHINSIELRIENDNEIVFYYLNEYIKMDIAIPNGLYKLKRTGNKYVNFTAKDGLYNIIKDLKDDGYMIMKWTERMPKRVTCEIYEKDTNKVIKRTTEVEVEDKLKKKNLELPDNIYSMTSKETENEIQKFARLIKSIANKEKRKYGRVDNMYIKLNPQDNIIEFGMKDDMNTDCISLIYKCMDDNNSMNKKPDGEKSFKLSLNNFIMLADMIGKNEEFSLGTGKEDLFIRTQVEKYNKKIKSSLVTALIIDMQ